MVPAERHGATATQSAGVQVHRTAPAPSKLRRFTLADAATPVSAQVPLQPIGTTPASIPGVTLELYLVKRVQSAATCLCSQIDPALAGSSDTVGTHYLAALVAAPPTSVTAVSFVTQLETMLSPSARLVLANVVQRLEHDHTGTVLITGYTDDIGTVGYNLGLSRRRAASVGKFLGAEVRNNALSYRTRGLGEADPVVPNTLPGG